MRLDRRSGQGTPGTSQKVAPKEVTLFSTMQVPIGSLDWFYGGAKSDFPHRGVGKLVFVCRESRTARRRRYALRVRRRKLVRPLATVVSGCRRW